MKMSRRKFLLGSGAATVATPGLIGLVGTHKGVEVGSSRQDSLWVSEAPPMPEVPQFESEQKVDLAIVGAGYTGLSCAYYTKLMRPDWKVVVLDSHGIGSGASSRNSGAVRAHQNGIADHEMPVRGLNRLRDFIDAEAIDCDFVPAPTLELHPSLRAAEKARTELAPGAKWLSRDELRERTGSDYFGGGIDEPGFFRVHPAKLVVGHARAALRVGAELYQHSPVLNVECGKPATLSTPHGRIEASNVMLATNAHTPRLGYFKSSMFPVHQYSFATRKLSAAEIKSFGLDEWTLRFENRTLPVSFGLTAGGHFFVRLVLGYASHNSCNWHDLEGARKLAQQIFEQRYPGISDIDLVHGWHGVTGHTVGGNQIAGAIGDGNVHISAAYNGSGIMPSHNNGYLTACQITGKADTDTRFLTGVKGQIPLPGDYYRSLMLKPFMSMMTPV